VGNDPSEIEFLSFVDRQGMLYSGRMTPPQVVWQILTLPCSEAARISSESLDRTLPFHDRLAVRLHTLACASCRRYRRQILSLRKTATRLAERVNPPGPALPDDVRERIKRSLRGD
jgi:hypothetical protein